MNMIIDGQMSIFDIMPKAVCHDEAFSWDSDINEVHAKLKEFATERNIETKEAEWAIWSHVPHLGYRMTFTMIVKEEDLTEAFYDSLYKIVDFAKSRNIDLSPTTAFFLGETAHFRIFSVFEDKERQKRKS